MTTSKEFNLWNQYFLEEPNEFNPLFYYLAAICAEIARGQVKNPKRIRLEDKLLEFKVREVKKAAPDICDDPEEALARRKQWWFAALGMSPSGIPLGRTVPPRNPPQQPIRGKF